MMVSFTISGQLWRIGSTVPGLMEAWRLINILPVCLGKWAVQSTAPGPGTEIVLLVFPCAIVVQWTLVGILIAWGDSLYRRRKAMR